MDGTVASSEKPRAPACDATAKEESIRQACRIRDSVRLGALAESRGGFLSNELRQHAWPILLGAIGIAVDDATADDWKELQRHRDEQQVELDVNRAFVHYPEYASPAQETAGRVELSNLIVEVLRRQPYLCYFQGFHDICQVFQLVLPAELRAPAVARLAVLRIRDFMLPSIDAAVVQLSLIPDILKAASPELWLHLRSVMEQPYFALAGTLTMYAHEITSLDEAARLFDVLLAREPVFTLYLYAATILSRRRDLFDLPAEDQSDKDILHSMLSKLPKPLDLDALVISAARLMAAHPPESLPNWRHISSASVLKTLRANDECASQTLDEGHLFFRAQVRDMEVAQKRRERIKLVRDMLKRHRGALGTISLAIAIGVIAVCLRRLEGTSPMSRVMAFFARWS